MSIERTAFQKGKLKIAFTVVAAATSLSTMAYPPKGSVGRPLTKGEADMAFIFGDEIDASVVNLHAGPPKGMTIAETFDTKTIAYYGPPYLSLDYSKTKDAVNYGSQFHEMTHIWQFQAGFAFTAGHCSGGYHYVLAKGRQFNDFCDEAQGAIVEDYARRYIKPVSAPSKWYVDMCGYDTPAHDALLLKIVEDRFPNAKTMRLMIGRGEVLPDARPRPAGDPTCSPKDPDRKGPGGGKGNGGKDGNGKQPGAGGNGPDGQPDGGYRPKDPGQKPPVSSKKGAPVYFCDTFADTLKKIKGIAFVEGLAAWNGFEAELKEQQRICSITIEGAPLINISGDDFGKDGQMLGSSQARLVEAIIRGTPKEIRGAIHSKIDTLFEHMVSQQIAEKAALRKMTSKPDIEKKISGLQTQLRDDPSLPDNSRGFLQEKVNILMAKLKPAPDKGGIKIKPDAGAPFNADGSRKKSPGEAKPKMAENGDPDRNIKDILNSAYGIDKGVAPVQGQKQAPELRGPS